MLVVFTLFKCHLNSVFQVITFCNRILIHEWPSPISILHQLVKTHFLSIKSIFIILHNVKIKQILSLKWNKNPFLGFLNSLQIIPKEVFVLFGAFLLFIRLFVTLVCTLCFYFVYVLWMCIFHSINQHCKHDVFTFGLWKNNFVKTFNRGSSRLPFLWWC